MSGMPFIPELIGGLRMFLIALDELYVYHMIICFCACFLVGKHVVEWYLERRCTFSVFKRYGIPGPEPSLFSGNAFEYLKDPVKALDRWTEEYGEIFGYFYGPRPYLVIHDLDMIKEVLHTEFKNFTDRPELEVSVKPITDSLVHLRGEKWKNVRRSLTQAFTGSKIKHMSKLINGSVSTLLKSIEAQDGSPFDVYQSVQGLTMDVIGKCALAMDVDCIRNPQEPLLVSTREYMKSALNNAVKLAIMFPYLGKVMARLYDYSAAGQYTDQICQNLKKVIAYRKKNPKVLNTDMLQLMMNAAFSERGVMGEKEVIGSCFAFVIAGFETTANALAYVFYLLAKHQEIQDHLLEEVENLPEEPSYDDIHGLKYLAQVIKEAMRLYPPVVTFVSRQAERTVVIEGKVIPEGVNVQVPVFQIHHNEAYWSDPDLFDPSRFSSDGKASIRANSFLPFGGGQRNCIGSMFAMFEAKLAVARVVQKFQLCFCDKTEDPLKLVVHTVTLNPANGVFLKAIPRSQ